MPNLNYCDHCGDWPAGIASQATRLLEQMDLGREDTKLNKHDLLSLVTLLRSDSSYEQIGDDDMEEDDNDWPRRACVS